MAPSTPNPDAIFDALISNRRDPAALRKRVETLEGVHTDAGGQEQNNQRWQESQKTHCSSFKVN